MNKLSLLYAIAETVRKKHPWRVSQEKYLELFGEYPKEFLAERLAYDNLMEKAKKFKLCILPESIPIDIRLTLDELIRWELSLDRWKDDVAFHNILPNDIKKLVKSE